MLEGSGYHDCEGDRWRTVEAVEVWGDGRKGVNCGSLKLLKLMWGIEAIHIRRSLRVVYCNI